MAFPAGRLPNAGELQTMAVAQRPGKSVAFVPGVELDLTDPANGLTPCALEFYATSGGTVIARLAGDTADRTYNVVANTQLPGLFVVIRAASTATGLVRQ